MEDPTPTNTFPDIFSEMRLHPLAQCDTPARKTPRSPKKRMYKRFVRGPIPLEWISHVAKLSNKSLHVGIALWYLQSLTDSMTVKLSHKTLETFGVSRWTATRNLRLMEKIGLVKVDFHPGRSPIVTIIDQEDISGCKIPHAIAENTNTP